MKRLLFIISITVIITTGFCMVVNAAGGNETPKIPINNTEASDTSTLSVADTDFQGEDFSFNESTEPSTSASTTKTNASKVAISKCKISGIKNKVYIAKAITQNLKVKYNGKVLKKGTDYTVSYNNNKNVGSATVTVRGKGNFKGTVKRTFKINPNPTVIKKVSSKESKKINVSWKKQNN